MRSARCPACSEEFGLSGESGGGIRVCSNCGCRVRTARPADDESEDRPGRARDSDVDRLYSDLEAERYSRQRRRQTLVIALGAVGTLFTAVVLVLVIAWPRPAPSSRAASDPSRNNRRARPADDDRGPPPPRSRFGREDDAPRDDGWREREHTRPVSGDRWRDDPGRVIDAGEGFERRFPEPPPREGVQRPATPAGEDPERPQKPPPDNAEARRAKENVLQLKLEAKEPAAEITKASAELAALGREGKEAACRCLCKAQLVPRGNDTASAALRKINPPLYEAVKKLLVDDDFENRLTGMREIGRLGEESVPVAAVDVLIYFKRQVLPDQQKSRAKVSYAYNPSAGEVIDNVWALTKERQDQRPKVKAFLKANLNDINPLARSAAAGCYAETDDGGDTISDLLDCLKKEKDRRRLDEKNAELVKRSDQVRVTIIRSLVAKGAGKRKSVKTTLEELSNREPSQMVREEATKAVEQINSGG